MDDYKPTKFCWECGRKLWGNQYVIKQIDGLPRTLHKWCAECLAEGLERHQDQRSHAKA